MFVNFNILNQLGSPAINSNTFANRPAAGQTGRLFVSTDTYEIYRDNGTTWDLIGGPGSSTITGSGTAGTIPLWTSTSAIGDSDLRQLSSQALILNSATNDWPTTQLANDPGRFLITNDTNQPMLILWSKAAFGTGDEYGTLNLGALTALGSTTIGGANLDGGIENNTDGSGYFELKTTNTAGVLQSALTVSSTQVATFKNNLIVNSPGRIGIQTATPGAALDVHSTGVIAQFNTTSATGNVNIALQRNGTGVWRLGDIYNGGNNFFELHNTVLTIDALEFEAATNKSTFQATQTYSTGLARGNYFDYNLSVAAGGSFSSPNAITALGASLDLTLAGSATIPSGARSGLDAYNSIGFTGTGTLTHTQGTQIRAYSNLTAGWTFNGSATGTITHLAGLRVLFPDNTGSAVTVTNNYGLLINNQTANTGTVTYTNRWGIYQEGSSDTNYFAGTTLVGTTVNGGYKFEVNGSVAFGNAATTFGVISRSVGINNTTVSSSTLWADSAPLNYIENKSTTANTAAGYAMQLGGGNAIAGILGIAESTAQAALGLFTGGTGTVAEKMRITSSGLVGIGTSTPAYKFVVSNAGAQGMEVDPVTPTVSGGVDLLFYNRTALAYKAATFIASQFSFDTGNVLIGTTTDSGQKLQVNGGNILTTYADAAHNLKGKGAITISASGGTQNFDANINNGLIIIGDNNTGKSAVFFYDYVSATTILIADPSSNFATTVTASKVSITKSANTTLLTITNNTTSTNFTIFTVGASD